MAAGELGWLDDRHPSQIWPAGRSGPAGSTAGGTVAGVFQGGACARTGANSRGKFLGVMPVVILVAQAGDGTLAGFLEAGLRLYADGCEHPIPSVMWKAGTSRRTGGSKGLERKCCELRRIGRAARDVSRWLQIRRSITTCRNVRTRRWDLKLPERSVLYRKTL